MNYFSLIKKTFNLLNVANLKKYSINSNMYFVNREYGVKNNEFKKILLYFPNHEFMHFGDHLFFEPLAKFLKETGFIVKIMPIKAMEFYFINNGYDIGISNDILDADLLITRVEMYNEVVRFKKNTLFVDITSSSIKNFLCQDIVNKIADFLSIDAKNFYAKPSKINNYLSKIELNPNIEYITFNNYIDSGFYRVRKKHYKHLSDFCKHFAKINNLSVIHIGTKKDKEKDKNYYDFVDIDLRGKTSAADLFYIASLGNVKFNISFDAFIMHIFFLYNKKSFILFRGRYTNKARNFVRQYMNPPFKPEPEINIENIAEYI
jgi:hypothetical protein